MPVYNDLTGWVPMTAEQRQRMHAYLDRRQGAHRFGDLAPQLAGTSDGKLCTPYKSVLKFDPKHYEQYQQRSDCVSWGTCRACDISRAVEIHIAGQPEEWVARGATEWVYGARGTTSDSGMYSGQATEHVCERGYLVRQKYPFADLTNYNPDLAVRLGGGFPSEMVAEAGKHKFRYWAKIETVQQACDAIANGYGLHNGANYIVGDRDQDGVAQYAGPAAHDMAAGFCDCRIMARRLLGIINSWPKNWISGGIPDWARDDGDDFANRFFIDERLAKHVIETGDCYAVGDFDGFPLRELPDYGSIAFL